MGSLKFAITALVTASIALGAAAPAFADPHRRGPGWGGHHRGPDRVVVIDRRDHRHHDRHHYAPPPRKVVVYRDRHHYDRYDRAYHHHHHHRRDNTGDVLLGVGLGAVALAGVLAATR